MLNSKLNGVLYALVAMLIIAPTAAPAADCGSEPSVSSTSSWYSWKKWCSCMGGTSADYAIEAQRQGGCQLPSGSGSSPSSSSDLVAKSTEGVMQGITSGDANLTGMGLLGIGTAMFLQGMKSDPAADARKAQAAAQVAEQQRQAEAEAMRQQELAKQRILGLLKGGESSTGLALKTDDSDAPLMVAETRGMFGSSEIVPASRGDSSFTVSGLQLKLGDDADSGGVLARQSRQAGQGFDTAGKMLGGDLPPPLPTPSMPSAKKAQILNALKSKLKKNQAEEQSLNNQLVQLKKATTPDPEAIKQVQEEIVVKEKEKEGINHELTSVSVDIPKEDPLPSRRRNPVPAPQ